MEQCYCWLAVHTTLVGCPNMGSPYDLSSGGGLRALALLDRAHNKRMSARHLRATAAVYTDEEDWVRNSRKLAKKQEQEAEVLERMARGK